MRKRCRPSRRCRPSKPVANCERPEHVRRAAMLAVAERIAADRVEANLKAVKRYMASITALQKALRKARLRKTDS